MYLVKIDNDKNIITSINDDEINWDNISSHRIMSNEFIEEHKDRINWDIFIDNNILTYEIVEKYIKYLKPHFNKLITTNNYINQDEKEKVKSLLFRCEELIDLNILELYGERFKNFNLEIKEIEYGLIDRYTEKILIKPYIIFSYDDKKYRKFKIILDLIDEININKKILKLDILYKNKNKFIILSIDKKINYQAENVSIRISMNYIISVLCSLLE